METVTTYAAEEVTTVIATTSTLQIKKPEPRLYRVIWRWHFYAGMIVLPVLVIAAVTGGIYVFREEIELMVYSDIMSVEPRPERVSYAQQFANASAAVPSGMHPSSMYISSSPIRAMEFGFHSDDDQYLFVYVNPHTAAVQGQRVFEGSFFDVILRIHRNLFVGTVGRVVVELATSWGIILSITGIYLWWPRGRNKVTGVWLPRVRGKSYLIWRDWHTVPGFYISLLAIIVMATGLFFSLLFGQGYDKATRMTGAQPSSYTNPPVSIPREGVSPLTLDQVVAIALQKQSQKEMSVIFPESKEASYLVLAGDFNSPSKVMQLYLDQYSGAVLDSLIWPQLSAASKLQLSAYPIHVGSIYGLPTKILAVLVCLLILAMSISGLAMWWVRRPRGRTGFPQKPALKPPKWLILLICLLGVVMPAAGISILLILVCDGIWRLWQKNRQRRPAIS